MSEDAIKNVAESTAELVRQLVAPTTLDLTRDQQRAAVVAVPAGITLKSIKPFLDEYLDRPERIKGTAVLEELDAFCAHANRFKDGRSAIFGTRADCRLQAVFDYHEEPGKPRFGSHRAVYAAPLSEEWEAWSKVNGKEISQALLAELIEDRIADVKEPTGADEFYDMHELAGKLGTTFCSPARLLELSRGLAMTVEQTVVNVVDPGTGERALVFTEEQKEKGTTQRLKIPGLFMLAIPVFRGGAVHNIAARLRYRVAGGEITWRIQLYRMDLVLDEAFDAICDTAQQQTQLPLFRGKPE